MNPTLLAGCVQCLRYPLCLQSWFTTVTQGMPDSVTQWAWAAEGQLAYSTQSPGLKWTQVILSDIPVVFLGPGTTLCHSHSAKTVCFVLQDSYIQTPGLFCRHMVLFLTGTVILIGRWQVMGSTVPTFEVDDNPHSFVNNGALRVGASSPARVSAHGDRDPGKPAWPEHFSRSGGMSLSANHRSSLLFTKRIWQRADIHEVLKSQEMLGGC